MKYYILHKFCNTGLRTSYKPYIFLPICSNATHDSVLRMYVRDIAIITTRIGM